jgi:hypothetical protein
MQQRTISQKKGKPNNKLNNQFELIIKHTFKTSGASIFEKGRLGISTEVTLRMCSLLKKRVMSKSLEYERNTREKKREPGGSL